MWQARIVNAGQPILNDCYPSREAAAEVLLDRLLGWHADSYFAALAVDGLLEDDTAWSAELDGTTYLLAAV